MKIYYRIEKRNHDYVMEIPDLDNMVVFGDTKSECIENAKVLIKYFLEENKLELNFKSSLYIEVENVTENN